MAITSIKTGSSFTNLQKYNDAVAGNPPLMAAPTATDGGTGSTASVAFTAVTGATSYGVLSSPGSFTATGTSSPLTVSGLTSGTAYTFQVRGVNSTSTGPYSAASNSVTPVTPSSFESIASATATGSSNTITFSSIPSTYTHLQIRGIGRNTNTGGGGTNRILITLNGDGGSNYALHYLTGNGSTVATNANAGNSSTWAQDSMLGDATTADCFGATIIDIHNYASSTQTKTLRMFSGANANGVGSVNIGSGLWTDTSAITEITLTANGANFKSGSVYSLYGIKG